MNFQKRFGEKKYLDEVNSQNDNVYNKMLPSVHKRKHSISLDNFNYSLNKKDTFKKATVQGSNFWCQPFSPS